MDSIINYDHINSIIARIPEMFYYALLGECVAMLGQNYYTSNNEIEFDFDTGTAGWAAALYATCKKLDMEWLYNEWTLMPYYDSDTLDAQIEEKLICMLQNEHTGINPYYKHVLVKMTS